MDNIKALTKQSAEEIGIELTDKQLDLFEKYYELLIEWNKKINLTALTEPNEVAVRHFCDSLSVLKYVEIPHNSSLVDVGTGAGFPGVVLKIVRPDINLCLLDSLNKRLVFLSEVCEQLSLENVQIVHSRAEDGAHQANLREHFDFAVSRAVASMNVLCEYCMGYVKKGGRFIAMKGKDGRAELDAAKSAVAKLGGKVGKVADFFLPDTSARTIIVIEKSAKIQPMYPRNAAKIKIKPL